VSAALDRSASPKPRLMWSTRRTPARPADRAKLETETPVTRSNTSATEARAGVRKPINMRYLRGPALDFRKYSA
jgi:hypothetical protein